MLQLLLLGRVELAIFVVAVIIFLIPILVIVVVTETCFVCTVRDPVIVTRTIAIGMLLARKVLVRSVHEHLVMLNGKQFLLR